MEKAAESIFDAFSNFRSDPDPENPGEGEQPGFATPGANSNLGAILPIAELAELALNGVGAVIKAREGVDVEFSPVTKRALSELATHLGTQKLGPIMAWINANYPLACAGVFCVSLVVDIRAAKIKQGVSNAEDVHSEERSQIPQEQ